MAMLGYLVPACPKQSFLRGISCIDTAIAQAYATVRTLNPPPSIRHTALLRFVKIGVSNYRDHDRVPMFRNRRCVMARWTLECSGCHQSFTYTEIPATVEIPLDPFLLWAGPKPEFPSGGMDVACPNCQQHSVYQRHELVFKDS
jgi:hypothetical protein